METNFIEWQCGCFHVVDTESVQKFDQRFQAEIDCFPGKW